MADDEVTLSPISKLVAGLLRGEPQLLLWEAIEAAGLTPEEWVDQIRPVCKNAGVPLFVADLPKPRMTLLYNEKHVPPFEDVQGYIARRQIERELKAATSSTDDEEPAL